ncbi:MAG: hypothetical protein F6J86_11210 [Symploca sp. SIO1B1]|nr:hypothetical protein [Symploca sp. SIO1B1]
MEDINNTSPVNGTNEKQAIQLPLMIQALAFTAILYFNVIQTPSNRPPETFPASQARKTLSAPIVNSILQQASQELKLPASTLRIVNVQKQTWSDNCLELRDSGVVCTRMQVSGWQVTVANTQNQWTYRTDTSGVVIKLANRHTSFPEAPIK